MNADNTQNDVFFFFFKHHF